MLKTVKHTILIHHMCETVCTLRFYQSIYFLCPRTPSGTEALPPAWNERYGVHQSDPHPEDQSWTRLCTEGTDQRAGKVSSGSVIEDSFCLQ